jgi:hypothetical protein
VKIQNLEGPTVFSTDPKQIGEDKGCNAGFLQAKAGGTKSAAGSQGLAGARQPAAHLPPGSRHRLSAASASAFDPARLASA